MVLIREISALLISYLISFCFITFLFVYILNVPGKITGNQELVDEYYLKGFIVNIPFDVLLVLAYLLFAQLIIYGIGVKNIVIRILIVMFTTLCISGYFYNMYLSYPENKNSFFSRWFHAVGIKAVIYDIVSVTAIYGIMVYILIQTTYKLNMGLK